MQQEKSAWYLLLATSTVVGMLAVIAQGAMVGGIVVALYALAYTVTLYFVKGKTLNIRAGVYLVTAIVIIGSALFWQTAIFDTIPGLALLALGFGVIIPTTSVS